LFSGAWLPSQGRFFQAPLFFTLNNSQTSFLYILSRREYYPIIPMNEFSLFEDFFQGKALDFLRRVIDLALEEDGQDLTSNAVFSPQSMVRAVILAKQDCVIAGLPFILQVLEQIPGKTSVIFMVTEGSIVGSGQKIALIQGATRKIFKAERVILNLLSRLSGIATLTRKFCDKLEGSGVRILDTRKTCPGLRYPEKYAVRVGGGENHRLNLESMLMLKDNHIDQTGSISKAVLALKKAYSPCPPIEVECRSVSDVTQAVDAGVQRIMLDNMSIAEMKKALNIIPEHIDSEISGRVDLDNIEILAGLRPTYLSSGALTHSADPVDLSMKIEV
jgi:nicotinate-nucleotide pyrophosphorylase (carboxylating)